MEVDAGHPLIAVTSRARGLGARAGGDAALVRVDANGILVDGEGSDHAPVFVAVDERGGGGRRHGQHRPRSRRDRRGSGGVLGPHLRCRRHGGRAVERREGGEGGRDRAGAARRGDLADGDGDAPPRRGLHRRRAPMQRAARARARRAQGGAYACEHVFAPVVPQANLRGLPRRRPRRVDPAPRPAREAGSAIEATTGPISSSATCSPKILSIPDEASP